jgi:superfamily I DNA/RNA helicase
VEVVERLVNLAKFAELAAAYVRRSPQATAREFARSIAAVADAGLREEEAVAGDRPVGVQVMAMHAAKGLEFSHVFVLGVMAARIPGRAAHARADPRRAAQGGAAGRHQGGPRRRDAAAAAHGDDARAATGS